jgi:hypothetical protein
MKKGDRHHLLALITQHRGFTRLIPHNTLFDNLTTECFFDPHARGDYYAVRANHLFYLPYWR